MSTEDSSRWLAEQRIRTDASLACMDEDQRSTQILGPGSSIRKSVPFEVRLNWPHIPGYEILSEIGSGAMGVVYKALHRDLRRTVALKLLRGAALTDPFYRERFQDEAEAVAKLQHPNIIQVFEFGATAPQVNETYPCLFISLEYVGGGSLAQQVGRKQTPQQVAAIVEKLARATHYAHRLGIIHRDLKPANVLMGLDDEPKIADFGVAKQLGDDPDARGRCNTLAGTLIGTPEYMAPEQVGGAAPNAAIDTYALGIILYELLTSRVPFQGSSSVETLDLVRHQEPTPPHRISPQVPRDLETICLKCLEKLPAHRYATSLDLAEDLRRFQDDLPIRARPIGDWERARRWCRRNPGLAASTTGVVAVFVIAFCLVTMSYLRTQRALTEAATQAFEAQRNEKSERWEHYRANLGAAASALELHNVGFARRMLSGAPRDFHNSWEWRHFSSRLDVSENTLPVFPTHAFKGEISQDCSRIFLAADDGRASIWNVNPPAEIRAYPSAASVFGAFISPDGKILLHKQDADLILRDIDSDRILTRIPGHDKPIYTSKFAWAMRRLVTCTGDNRICVWSVPEGKLIWSTGRFSSPLDGLVVSDDGKVAATTFSTENDPVVLNLETGALTKLLGHQNRPGILTFSPQGDRLVSIGVYPDLTTRLYETQSGKLLVTYRAHTNAINQAAFSQDRTRLATCSLDQTIVLRHGMTGQPIAILKGHSGWVNTIAFSPDSKRLVSCSQDRTVRLWDATTGDALAILHGHTGNVLSVGFSSNGEKIVSTSEDGTGRTWDAPLVERNGVLRGHTDFAYHVAVHPDGQNLASAGWDGTVRLWNMDTGKQNNVLDHGPKAIVGGVAFHPTGKLLASRARDAVRIWDYATGHELFRFAIPSDSWRDSRLAFSPDGKLLTAGCANSEVKVWDIDARTELATLRGHEDQIRDVLFSPDGRTIASSGEKGDRTIRLWDLDKKALKRTLRGHTDCVYALAFHPLGKQLASAGSDGTIRFWDVGTGVQIGDPIFIGSNAYGLAFTPDGTRLASACADNVIRFWDSANRQEVAELRGHDAYVHAVAFTPDCERLVSASGDCTVRIWDTRSSHERYAATK